MRELELLERDKIIKEAKFVEENLADLNEKLINMGHKQNVEVKTKEFQFRPSNNQTITPSVENDYDQSSCGNSKNENHKNYPPRALRSKS